MNSRHNEALELLQSLGRRRRELIKQLEYHQLSYDEAISECRSLANRPGLVKVFTRNYEQRLESAKQKLKSAEFKRAETQKELERVIEDEKKAQGMLKQRAEQKYSREKELKIAEDKIMSSSGDKKDCLLELNEQILQLTKQKDRLLQARQTAQKAYDAAFYAYDSADTASKIAKWDATPFRIDGGEIGDLFKHDKLEQAQRGADMADIYLKELAETVQDLRENISLAFPVGTKLRDILWDDIFGNIKVKREITAGRDEIISMRDKVYDLKKELYLAAEDVQKEIDACMLRKENLLLDK